MEQGVTGRFIAECRKEKGYSQKQLAGRLCVTEQAVSRWERGVGYPDITLLIPLSQELDVTVLELMEGRKMKKEASVSKQQVERSIEYYMASSLDSRKSLGHAIIGLQIWFICFIVFGAIIVFSISGKTGAGYAMGYYFSVGCLISIFWCDKVRKMAVEYGVIAEREYEYEAQEEENGPIPYVMLPVAIDGYRRNLPTIMPMRRADGTQMKLGELLLGFCKAVAIMLSIYFWGAMNYWSNPTLSKIEMVVNITSPFIIAGIGLAIHGIYQIVRRRGAEEGMGVAKIKTAVGITLAVAPTLMLLILASFSA